MQEAKKSLVLTQVVPDGQLSGANKRMANWLKAMAARSTVHLEVVSLDPEEVELPVPAAMLKLCKSSHRVDLSRNILPRRSAGQRFRDHYPEHLSLWPLQEATTGLSHLRDQHFDEVLIVRLKLYPIWDVLTKQLGVTANYKVMDLDDVESANYRRQLEAGGVSHYGRLGWLLQRLDVWRYARLEETVARQFDRVVLCSAADARALALRSRQHAACAVVPNCVEVPDSMVQPPADHGIRLLFLGHLAYRPNIEAVHALVQDILPHIRQRLSPVTVDCEVVGRSPPAWMSERQDIELHANVPSVAPFYARCHALIVPLRSGGGTRLKILEALSYGCPVISTAIGAEGLDICDRVHFLRAETPEDMSAAVLELMTTPGLRAKLVEQGRLQVERMYGYANFASAVSQLFATPPAAGRMP